MSDAFQDRENTFEKQFAHDEDLRFKAVARRNKAVALWVAETKGLSGADAEKYASEFVGAQIGKSDEDVEAALKADLAGGNVDLSDHRLRKKMDEEMAAAVASVQSGQVRKGAWFTARRTRERRESGGDRLVDFALERHHKLWKTLETLPAPIVKFGIVGAAGGMVNVDLLIRANKPEQKPLLGLPAIPAAPPSARVFRQIVFEPLWQFRDQFGRTDVGLFPKLALRGFERLFSRVDSPLRHLPRARVQDFGAAFALAMADERVAGAIDQRDADTWAIQAPAHGLRTRSIERTALMLPTSTRRAGPMRRPSIRVRSPIAPSARCLPATRK